MSIYSCSTKVVLLPPVEPGQYTPREFDKYCTEHHIRRSLGKTVICDDNAVSESFFATYKKELIHNRPWPNLKILKKEKFTGVAEYYNRTRRHSSLEYLTPTNMN